MVPWTMGSGRRGLRPAGRWHPVVLAWQVTPAPCLAAGRALVPGGHGLPLQLPGRAQLPAGGHGGDSGCPGWAEPGGQHLQEAVSDAGSSRGDGSRDRIVAGRLGKGQCLATGSRLGESRPGTIQGGGSPLGCFVPEVLAVVGLAACKRCGHQPETGLGWPGWAGWEGASLGKPRHQAGIQFLNSRLVRDWLSKATTIGGSMSVGTSLAMG